MEVKLYVQDPPKVCMECLFLTPAGSDVPVDMVACYITDRHISGYDASLEKLKSCPLRPLSELNPAAGNTTAP